MPSWYTLYLAVIGAYFLVRHHETGGRVWLFAAGVAGGLSLCCKITGVWYVLAVAVYLVYREQERPADPPRDTNARRGASRKAVFVAVPAAPPCSSAPCSRRSSVRWSRSTCCCRSWYLRADGVEGVPSRVRGAGSLASLCGSALPFLAGVTFPLLFLAAPYLATGSLGDLYTGLFVTPRGRLESGYSGTAGPAAFIFAFPSSSSCSLSARGRGRRATPTRRIPRAGRLLLISTVTLVGYLTMWYTTTSLLPVGIIVGVAVLARDADPGVRVRQSLVFLLLSLSAFIGLVQFPFGAPVYFCFVAPLAVLAWLAMFRHTPLHASSSRSFLRCSSRRSLLRIRGQPQRPLLGRDCAEWKPADGHSRPRSRLDPGQPNGPGRLPRDDGVAPGPCTRAVHLRRPRHA